MQIITPPESECSFDKSSSAAERESLHRNILTAVSHDLKTPLACIIGSIEIYKRSKEKLSLEKKNILIDTALQEAYRLNGFITNILDMAKLEQGMVKPSLAPYDIKLLINDCLITMGLRLEACKVLIKAPDLKMIITTDYVLLSRAICLVLDNAAKYCSANSIITIEYKKIGEKIEICIKDNGLGIPESKMEDIFSKYLRISKQDYQIAGTGLGLPICREIMSLLGGTVTAANVIEGKGAIFTLVA